MKTLDRCCGRRSSTDYAGARQAECGKHFPDKKKNVGGTGLAGLAFGEMFKVAQWVDQVETLRTSETTWEDLDEEHSFVKRGDPVLQVLEPEREGEQTPRAASLK